MRRGRRRWRRRHDHDLLRVSEAHLQLSGLPAGVLPDLPDSPQGEEEGNGGVL